jgi:hypothetical protein
VILDPKPLAPPSRVAVVVPSQFSSKDIRAIIAVVQIDPPTDSPERVQAIAAFNEQLNSSTNALVIVPTNNETGVTTALRAMRRKETARVAMISLATDTGATVLSDVALVAREPVIEQLAPDLIQCVERANTADVKALGWLLDRATLEHLGTMQSSQTLPPELSSITARVAGEAARSGGSLGDLLHVATREEFEARLTAENFTYLEDASPAARVRAYDWLAARGRAPASYDPLGTPKERAAAIDTSLAAQASTPNRNNATPGTGGAP